MTKTCILLGDRSDIAKALVPFLEADGWEIHGWHRGQDVVSLHSGWDLFLSAIGRVSPVGEWCRLSSIEFSECVYSNAIFPVDALGSVWSMRNPGAKACFMAGSNPQKIMPGYLPYNLSKMALLKAVEQIDAESPDCTVFALGPGYVKTKIHNATLEAGWPNERIARGDDGTPIERIWECLKWCLAQPKEVVGGRNICVTDPWGDEDDPIMGKSVWGEPLAERLRANPAMFKLRRVE